MLYRYISVQVTSVSRYNFQCKCEVCGLEEEELKQNDKVLLSLCFSDTLGVGVGPTVDTSLLEMVYAAHSFCRSGERFLGWGTTWRMSTGSSLSRRSGGGGMMLMAVWAA